MPHRRQETTRSDRLARLTVLHFAQPAEGGVARVVTDLVRAQTREGARVVVACPPGGGLASAAAAVGAEVHPWRADRQPGPGLPGEILRAARLTRRIGPDVVHAHSAKAGLAVRLAVRGRTATVFQPHAWSFDAVGGLSAELALRWERFAARWAARVVCVSEDERSRGRSAGVSAPWTVIRNGVDLDHFRPPDASGGPDAPDPAGPTGAADQGRARARLPALDGLPPQTPLVVCVGRLCPQKGQDLLLRAWPEVTARVPSARLALVGDGPERRRLCGSAPDGVLFAGATGDAAPWYRAADLVVLPSRWEGMALAPLEAMACGRPVVVTDVSGARESLPAAQRPVCLVPPDEPMALSRALTGLLTNPQLRDTLGRQAQDHVRTTHDVRRTAAAVSELYRDLLGLPHPECRERIRR